MSPALDRLPTFHVNILWAAAPHALRTSRLVTLALLTARKTSIPRAVGAVGTSMYTMLATNSFDVFRALDDDLPSSLHLALSRRSSGNHSGERRHDERDDGRAELHCDSIVFVDGSIL